MLDFRDYIHSTAQLPTMIGRVNVCKSDLHACRYLLSFTFLCFRGEQFKYKNAKQSTQTSKINKLSLSILKFWDWDRDSKKYKYRDRDWKQEGERKKERKDWERERERESERERECGVERGETNVKEERRRDINVQTIEDKVGKKYIKRRDMKIPKRTKLINI